MGTGEEYPAPNTVLPVCPKAPAANSTQPPNRNDRVYTIVISPGAPNILRGWASIYQDRHRGSFYDTSRHCTKYSIELSENRSGRLSYMWG
jgi:hypothetical protein